MRDMRRIIRWVSAIILPIGAAMFSRQYASVDLSLADAVTGTVASVLGMIPEGLIFAHVGFPGGGRGGAGPPQRAGQ